MINRSSQIWIAKNRTYLRLQNRQWQQLLEHGVKRSKEPLFGGARHSRREKTYRTTPHYSMVDNWTSQWISQTHRKRSPSSAGGLLVSSRKTIPKTYVCEGAEQFWASWDSREMDRNLNKHFQHWRSQAVTSLTKVLPQVHIFHLIDICLVSKDDHELQ